MACISKVTPAAYGYAELASDCSRKRNSEIVTPIYSGSSAILSGSCLLDKVQVTLLVHAKPLQLVVQHAFYAFFAAGATMTAGLMVGFSTPKEQQ